MNDYSYDDDMPEIDWMSKCTEMANTIDALNTNIILLNKFIESALNILDNTYFKENVEITTFDASGNIMTCVKTDGSGNFIPCVFMDLSHNALPFVLPHGSESNSKQNRERSFSPYSPYYYPYSPYGLYNPYNPYTYPYTYYASLLNDDPVYREIPPSPENPINNNNELPQPNISQRAYPQYNESSCHQMSYHRPPYHRPPYHRPPYYRPPYYRPPYYRPPYQN